MNSALADLAPHYRSNLLNNALQPKCYSEAENVHLVNPVRWIVVSALRSLKPCVAGFRRNLNRSAFPRVEASYW